MLSRGVWANAQISKVTSHSSVNKSVCDKLPFTPANPGSEKSEIDLSYWEKNMGSAEGKHSFRLRENVRMGLLEISVTLLQNTMLTRKRFHGGHYCGRNVALFERTNQGQGGAMEQSYSYHPKVDYFP